jgi:hypothetical protein
MRVPLRLGVVRKVAYLSVLALVAGLVALPAFGAGKPNREGSRFVSHFSQAVQVHYYLTHPDQAPSGFEQRIEATGPGSVSGPSSPSGIGPTGDRFNRDATGFPQNEESVTVCRNKPSIVVSGTNDYRGLLDPEVNFTGWYLSTNGGKSVAKEGLLPSVDLNGTQTPSGGDPVEASDGTCNIYAASLAYSATDAFGPTPNGVVAYKTTPAQLKSSACGNATDALGNPIMSDPDCWDGAVIAQTVGGTTGHFYDKPWMAVGDTGDGQHVWFTYSDFTQDASDLGFSKAQVYAVRCDEDLTNCTTPILISSNDDDVFFSQVTVGPDGRTYVTWAGVQGELTGEPQTFSPKIRIAPAGSTTFGPEHTIATLPNAIGFDTLLHADDFRIATQPRSDVTMVHGHPRELIVFDTCGHRLFGAICEAPKIRVGYSDDDGATWTFKRVSGGGDNYFPTISADPETNKIAVSWYTSAFDRYGHRYDVELATLGRGLRLLDRQRVTSVSNEPNADFLLGGVFIGDYFQVTALNGRAYIAYNANYVRMRLLGEGPPEFQQDNYLSIRKLA